MLKILETHNLKELLESYLEYLSDSFHMPVEELVGRNPFVEHSRKSG